MLQQLVDWRRAGKPAPSLARVQRAMVWSDGTIELNTVAPPSRRPVRARDATGQTEGTGASAVMAVTGAGPHPEGGQRAGLPGGDGLVSAGTTGEPRESTAGMPRAGEGWALIRAGETPLQTPPGRYPRGTPWELPRREPLRPGAGGGAGAQAIRGGRSAGVRGVPQR